MSIDLTALKNEITTDPKSLGYAGCIAQGSDSCIVELMNSTSGPGVGTVPHEPISPNDFVALIDPNEFRTLTALDLSQIQVEEAAGAVNFGDPNVQNWLDLIFSSGNAPITHNAMHSKFTRTASRAEVLFGRGTVITSDVVAEARNA